MGEKNPFCGIGGKKEGVLWQEEKRCLVGRARRPEGALACVPEILEFRDEAKLGRSEAVQEIWT